MVVHLDKVCKAELSWVQSTLNRLRLLKPATLLWFLWDVLKMKLIRSVQRGGTISDVKDACEELLCVSSVVAISLCQRVPLSAVQLFAVAYLSVLNLFNDLGDDSSLAQETKERYSACLSALPPGCLSHEYSESVSCVQQLLHESQSRPLSFEERLRLSDCLRWQLCEYVLHVRPLLSSCSISCSQPWRNLTDCWLSVNGGANSPDLFEW